MTVDLTTATPWLWLEAILFALLLVSAPSSLHRDFAAAMNFMRVRDRHGLSPITTILGTYLVARGYLLDLLVNIVHMTVLMRELPRELTVTKRVARLKFHGTERQRRVASWFCDRHGLQLDDLDPSGCHCKQPQESPL
jgi:hypothetical protein